jgi:ArsR family transcriptional regulator
MIRELADVFRGLADRSRLHILFLLARHGEMNVTMIGDELGQSQPAVSHHLSQLKNVGLIECRREGKFNFYRLDPDGLAPLVRRLFPAPGSTPVVDFGGLEVFFKQPQ